VNLAGRTIISTSPLSGRYGEEPDSIVLTLDDGSQVELVPTGYEAEGVRIERIEPAEVRRRQRAAQGRRELERVQRLSAEVYRRRAKERRDRMERNLSPEAFREWRRRHEPGFIMKEIWSSDALTKQFYDENPFLSAMHQEIDGAVQDLKSAAKRAVIPIYNAAPAKPTDLA
jgi:phytoene dehydrogenase-like protein